ncbi:helix-turn-helix domain-containing protein [uncultured Desulfovibrio sp.]|uniref:helix-turn-helix domain-containing protein n=1 Tax=uncultured Desulfovibrio sp. TaxID=167968 RepID=UPI003432386D
MTGPALPRIVAGGPRRPEPRQEAESRDRSAIEAALRNHPGSMEDAARSLGCSRQTLWRKMKKYGIQR